MDATILPQPTESISALARRFGVSRSTIRHRINKGVIRVRARPQEWLIPDGPGVSVKVKQVAGRIRIEVPVGIEVEIVTVR